MTFQDLDKIEKELGIGGSDYTELESGENIIRILSQFEPVATHFRGPKGKKIAIPCTRNDNCKLCAKGDRPSYKGLLYLYNNLTKSLEVGELPWTVMRGIHTLSKSTQYKFDGLPKFDIIINKKGEGKKTKYTVMAGPNKDPLAKVIMDELKDSMGIKELAENKFISQMAAAKERLMPAPAPGTPEPSIEAGAEVSVDDLPFTT